MTLPEFLLVVRRAWVALLVGAVVGLVGGGAATALRHPVYTATADAYVSTGRADSLSDLNQSGSYSQQVVKSFAAIATTGYVLKPVIAELHLPVTVAALQRAITTTAGTDTTLVTVEVQYPSARLAAAIANAVTTRMAKAVETLNPTRSSSTAVRVTQLDTAAVPTAPSSPVLALDLGVGLLVGLGGTLAGALLRERFRTRLRSVRDLRAAAPGAVLGLLPVDPAADGRRILLRDAPRSPEAEAVRSLRANLAFLKFREAHRAIVVTSAQAGEGKSSTAANLAIALADARQSVVLVDGDLRLPRVAERFGLDGAVGLSDVLIERATLDEAVQTGPRGVAVLPAGDVPPNPSELLASDDLRALVARLRERYQWVIVDAPPVLPVADAMILADATDGAIVVCELGRTTGSQLQAALAELDGAGARLLGLVANRVPRSGAHADPVRSKAYGYGAALVTSARAGAAPAS